ncbi:MAG: M24 family metallopeptidase, partial [Oscillospiraceae bacterium]|nr:M24 family metallopeptidase [Oscillospiraceae bacterium]
MLTVPERLAALRAQMKTAGVDVCYIPTSDDRDSEYPDAHFAVRQYFSGFTGSAGTLVVTQTTADLWTDSRYYLQAEAELRGSTVTLRRAGEKDTPKIADHLKTVGGTLGFDHRVVSLSQYRRQIAPSELPCVDFDPAATWQSRPPLAPTALTEIACGETRREKLSRIRATLRGETLLLCSLDEIAWTLDLRSDAAFTPTFYAYLAVSETAALLFTDAPTPDLSADVTVLPYDAVYPWAKTAQTVRTDETVNLRLYRAFPQPPRIEASCAARWKAIKNETEIAAMQDAHLREGLAVTRLLLHLKDAPQTERAVCAELERLRREDETYLGESFATIAAADAHGAIVHYQPSAQTDAKLDALFLLDCGGQYESGTTDLTRTVALQKPTAEQIRNYTAVLRGHLAVAMAQFSETERGDGLDKLARAPLAEYGLSYGHGTGHGVGFRLAVHETPPSIRPTPGEPFAPGMIVSDEPGTYLEGQYGIRLENLLLCISLPPIGGKVPPQAADEGQKSL